MQGLSAGGNQLIYLPVRLVVALFFWGEHMGKYSELLKDPRWQKKRLEIMERDGWKCVVCDDKENTLHVHHKWYEKGLNPWDYKADCLVTLCDNCHKFEHSIQKSSINAFVKAFLSSGFLHTDLVDLAHDITSNTSCTITTYRSNSNA